MKCEILEWHQRPESFRSAIIAVEYPYSESVVYQTLAASGWDERIARAALSCAARAYGGALYPRELHPAMFAASLRQLVDEAQDAAPTTGCTTE